MYRQIIIFSFLLVVSWASQSFAQTALEKLAVSMAPGTWAEFSTNGLTWDLIQPTGGGSCPSENHLEYSSTGVYDGINKKIGALAGPHSGTVGGACFPENIVFLIYDETTNSWSLENQNTTGLPSAGHGYNLTALDPTTGDVYVSVYNSNGLWRRNANGTWQSLGNNPFTSCSGNTCASGTTWDPNRKGYIRFGDSTEQGVTLWNKSTGSWTQLTSHNAFGGFGGSYHFWAGFHPPSGLIWLHDGNGQPKHWKLNTNNTVTPLAPPPLSLGCCGRNGRLTAYDVRTQKFVVANPFTNALYEYDIVSDSWRSLGSNLVPFNHTFDTGNVEAFVTTINAYGGVIMYVVGRGSGADPKVFLYKHDSGGISPVSDNTPPSTPTNLSAAPVSSSQINLVWTASTDNVGVIGYRVERCQGSNCTTFTQIATPSGTSHSDTGLTANTTYRYRVRATDMPANVSGYSSIVTAVTQGATVSTSGCSSEGGLAGRTDILHCEAWENANWWQSGYLEVGSKTKPYPATGPDQTEIVTSGCISGSCLKVNMKSWRDGGAGGALAHHWPIPGNQEEVYLRYYLKLAPNFSPKIYSVGSGAPQGSGGKFPGLGDIRAYPDSQCGNGGYFSDGINCWSARAKYRDCFGSGGANVCQPNATTRFGHYWYLPPNTGSTNQAMGAWDGQAWGTANGPCAAVTGLGNWNTASTGCGKGVAGLINGQWYLIEWQIKMNVAGVANGIARGWIDGVLKYEKTNVEFRKVGHDNLHVRTVWLNVHAGGEFVGPDETTALYLDQMVVSTGARPGAWVSPTGGGGERVELPTAPVSLTVK